MYTNYFGLKENPFSTPSDPRYFFVSDLHREALAQLLYGISSDESFILLTGDVGTGKTMTCHYLLSQLPENADVVFVATPRITPLELFETICTQLTIPLQESEPGVPFYLDELKRYLLDAHSRGRVTSLLIDEAQSMSLDFLEQLRLISNLEEGSQKLLKIVLLGQPELKQVLEKNGSDQVSKRITSHYHLLPLEKEDVFNYIRYRLAVAGGNGKFFTDAAISKIYTLSLGVPRLVNMFCDRAMLDACKDEEYLVSEKIVDRAAREVTGDVASGEAREEKKTLLRPAVLVVCFLVLGSALVLFFLSGRIASLPGSSPDPGATALVSSPLGKEGLPEVADKAEGAVEPDRIGEKPRAGRIRIVPLEISE